MKAKMRILLVEDEPGVSMMMVHLLTRAGCEVEVAWNAAKGMALAQAGDFDLITLAADLPGLNGFEFCRRLKKDVRLRHTPVVLVSGRSSKVDARRGMELGAADYITKPFVATDFIFRIMSNARVNVRAETMMTPGKASV
jgi:DNA-binding response OmpR family regulator